MVLEWSINSKNNTAQQYLLSINIVIPVDGTKHAYRHIECKGSLQQQEAIKIYLYNLY